MAFTSLYGLYQFTRLPFVLFGAPATFNQLMDQVLCLHTVFAAANLDELGRAYAVGCRDPLLLRQAAELQRVQALL